MTLQEEVARRIAGDPLLARLRRKIDGKNADFKDTAAYSNRAADIMSEIFARRLPELSLAEREALCVEMLRDRHTDINELLSRVQLALDDAAGIHIAPQHTPFNSERAHQIGRSTADPTVSEETQQRRARSAPATAARAMHDDYIRKNADFRNRAGLKCYINREAVPGCCAWCTAMAGRFEYGEEPDDIYRRHDNCDCTVTFENGRKRQDVWSKREWEAPEPGAGAGERVVLPKEQAERLQAEHQLRYLTGGQKPAIIKLPDIEIGRSVGAKAKNYDIMDLATGEIFHLVEGTRLHDVEVFAGKGTRTIFRDAEKYAERYGGNPENWQHTKGFGTVDYYGDEIEAELHWVQCEGIGKFEFFVKRWFE